MQENFRFLLCGCYMYNYCAKEKEQIRACVSQHDQFAWTAI